MVRFGFSFGFSFQFRVEVWGFLVWGLGFSLVSLHTHPRALANGPRLCPPTPSLFSLAISLSSLSLSLSLSLSTPCTPHPKPLHSTHHTLQNTHKTYSQGTVAHGHMYISRFTRRCIFLYARTHKHKTHKTTHNSNNNTHARAHTHTHTGKV